MARRPQPQQLNDAAILEEACARNRPIELHYYNHSGEFFAARTRLLGIEKDHLQLDAPQSIGKEVHFSSGLKVEAFILVGDHIHTFRSQIVKSQCHIKLNRYHTVDGLYITKPKLVKDGQRRHDLRVSVASLEDDIGVLLHDCCQDDPNSAPVKANVFDGRLVNISGGGCGLIVNTIQCSKLNIGRHMFIGFTLPAEETTLIFQIEVRTVQLVGSNEQATRLGVQFLNWPNQAYLRRTLRPVERFVAELQRMSSRRRADRR